MSRVKAGLTPERQVLPMNPLPSQSKEKRQKSNWWDGKKPNQLAWETKRNKPRTNPTPDGN